MVDVEARATTEELLQHSFISAASPLPALVPYIEAVKKLKEEKAKGRPN